MSDATPDDSTPEALNRKDATRETPGLYPDAPPPNAGSFLSVC